jgi:stage II sporulation protein D
MRSRLIAAGVALALLGLGGGARLSASAGEPPLVRVGVAVEQPAVRIEGDGPIAAVDLLVGSSALLIGGPWVFQPTATGMSILGTTFGPAVRLTAQTGFLRVNGVPYRGVIELRRTAAARVTAINEVDIEWYLYGVIKGEIDPHWPPEAVKAQAVAARTLALENLASSHVKYPAEGYQLRATTDSQVYLGVAGEDPAAIAAVEATRGLVATFHGDPIFAAYHSNSGGHTEDSENVWGTSHPYLRGVPDPFALQAPGSQWAARLPLSTIEEDLRHRGVDVAGLVSVEPGRVTPWGRAITVRLVEEGGKSEDLSANQFRLVLGASLIRSTMFTMTREGAEMSFTGRGSGHGVGLDQWGARAMALQGYTFEQILSYYYTGISVERRY